MKDRLPILLITLLAFALRAYRLDTQALWWDESLTVYRATRDLATILANTIVIQSVVTTDLMPPLYFVIQHFLVRAFGISEFALRFLSLAANVATVPLIYALGKRWFDLRVARIAAFLAALSPFYVWYAQEARPYALVLFFSTLAIYALARALELRMTNYELRLTHPASPWLILYILATIASLYTHYYAGFLLPFHVALITLTIWRDEKRRAWILLPAIPSTSIIFLLPIVLRGAANNVNSGPTIVALDIILRDLLNSFSVGITMDAAQAAWIDGAILALLVIGIVFANSKLRIANCELRISLLAYLALPILTLLIAQLARPLYQNSRYFIAISPAFYLGVAAGIAAISSRWKILAIPAFAIFLLGAIPSLNNLYFDPRWGKDDHRAWAQDLRERVYSDDVLILNSPHTEELFHYYADDIVPIITLPILRADNVPSPAADRAAVRDALTQHARVWYLEMHAPFDDPDSRIEKLLQQEGVLLDQAHARGTSTKITLALYTREFPTANSRDIPHALDLAFDGHLRLRGFDAPSAIKPGSRIAVKLFWQIDEPVGEDYAISLRLADASGALVAQWDAIPLGNRAGSSTWQTKQIVVDAREIAMTTQPGIYRWQVVPYHAATGNPLGDVVALGETQITP
ncbi:MAG: glycosyltransferase family 39 protein [Chloroflexi bacterium]|nr:glycosyltransferase family 39 protein [Chloroflexota bacterium]